MSTTHHRRGSSRPSVRSTFRWCCFWCSRWPRGRCCSRDAWLIWEIVRSSEKYSNFIFVWVNQVLPILLFKVAPCSLAIGHFYCALKDHPCKGMWTRNVLFENRRGEMNSFLVWWCNLASCFRTLGKVEHTLREVGYGTSSRAYDPLFSSSGVHIVKTIRPGSATIDECWTLGGMYLKGDVVDSPLAISPVWWNTPFSFYPLLCCSA